MIYKTILSLVLAISLPATSIHAEQDTRQLVDFPDTMRTHMLGNMRDHLVAIDEILAHLAADELEKAADVAESRLGFSSLESHGASHIAQFMPEGMAAAGTAMHRAASQFARVAQEGEALPAYKKLQEITAACTACHAGYRAM
jgi:hypothetical protein